MTKNDFSPGGQTEDPELAKMMNDTAATRINDVLESSMEDTTWSIQKVLEAKEDINLTATTNVFNKVEIRKMLHPEINIEDIAPYVPEKTVRVTHNHRPYSRWKHFQTGGGITMGSAGMTRPYTVPANMTRATTSPGSRLRVNNPRVPATMKRPSTEHTARLLTPFRLC